MIHPVLHLRVRQREEIINACEQLYRTMNFREITLKEIGSITSFSRSTIYNYFQTKEEIFLALLRLLSMNTYDMEANSRQELQAGVNYVYQTVYELTYDCLIRLL